MSVEFGRQEAKKALIKSGGVHYIGPIKGNEIHSFGRFGEIIINRCGLRK